MKPALVLVDLQRDFLQQPAFSPEPEVLVQRAAALLNGCRQRGLPVLHVHTRIRPDGADRMPHWKQNQIWQCIEGTEGMLPPEPLRPRQGETVVYKKYFSAFGAASFADVLAKHQVDTLIVAGVQMAEGVRSTVMDAYERGFVVWMADDAVGFSEAAHAELTRIELEGRAATLLDSDQILNRLATDQRTAHAAGQHPVPVAHIAGQWVSPADHRLIERRNPSNWAQTLATVPIATRTDVAEAARSASAAQRSWGGQDIQHRVSVLEAWAAALGDRREELAQLLAIEIGKPLSDGHEEIRRAILHVRSAAALILAGDERKLSDDPPTWVRFRPHGVVGIITPWNNPVAIPVGKIAPALAFGNGVVWKPAFEAPRIARTVLDGLIEVGLPKGLVSLVFGDASTARAVMDSPVVSAVSLTGSVATGQQAAARCLRLHKPFQAELGGNNAAIVLGDCDLRAEAHAMACAAFSFAGQRCTSIQRFIVERPLLDEFQQQLVAAVASLRVGDPLDPATDIGPLISETHRQRVQRAIEQAVSCGARLLCGGTTPEGLDRGCWLAPAVVGNIAADAGLAQDEAFGPVAVILPADDLNHAIEIANGVPHGLVAALSTQNESARHRFAAAIQAGMLKLAPGPFRVHPDAPFGGWKASRIGPPEHGTWDRDFFAQVQTIYE